MQACFTLDSLHTFTVYVRVVSPKQIRTVRYDKPVVSDAATAEVHYTPIVRSLELHIGLNLAST